MTKEQTETMSWEDWVEAYRPKPNPLRPFHEGDATSLMHETFGAEYALVEAADRPCIWTLVECDNDDRSDVDDGVASGIERDENYLQSLGVRTRRAFKPFHDIGQFRQRGRTRVGTGNVA